MARRGARKAGAQTDGPRKLLDGQLAWQNPRYIDKATEPLSADQIRGNT